MSINGTNGYNWESLAAVGVATAGAITTNVLGSQVPTSINETVTLFAGILTVLHVHVPSVVNKVGPAVVALLKKEAPPLATEVASGVSATPQTITQNGHTYKLEA